MEKNKYNEALEEMLDLAGIPINETDEDEEEYIDADDVTDATDDDDDDDDDESDEELNDTWTIKIGTSGTLKVELHDSYLYTWYKNKRSSKVNIPSRLRPLKKDVSELFNKILSHVEKVS